MKINIEQLPSGAYRIRKTIKGKTYRITVDYKPTESEALRLLSDVMGKGGKARTPLTFGEAAERHLSAVEGVLSASTVSGQRVILHVLKRDYRRFCAVRIRDMTSEDVQRVIMRRSRDSAPHTVRNMYVFIRAVLRQYAPDLRLSVSLPAVMPKEPYIPSEDDLRRIYEAFKGGKYEIPFRLGLCGLRRSEICGADLSDLDDSDRLYVHRVMLRTDNGWIIADRTKNPNSTRHVQLPADLADLIREQGYIYHGKPPAISEALKRVEDRLGMPRFSLHKLRHYYVSYAHTLVPEAFILENCGYKSDTIMKRVYRHALSDKREEMDKKVLDSMTKMLS